MSAMNAWTFSGTHGVSGPGLDAPYLDNMGWIPSTRVWSPGASERSATITLAALNHPEANGYLTARIPQGTKTYYLEYRKKHGWDRGIPRAAVLAHEVRDDKLSHILSTPAGQELLPGRQAIIHDMGVKVLGLDVAASTATIQVSLPPRHQESPVRR